MWIPGYERWYNETVPQDKVYALGSEYMDFSVPASAQYQEPFPGSAVWGDQYSDTLYLIPRLQNYADPLQGYFDAVIGMREGEKP